MLIFFFVVMDVFYFNSEDSKSSRKLISATLLFGPLGLKMFTWRPKVRQILALFYSAIYSDSLFLPSFCRIKWVWDITDSKWYGTKPNSFGAHGNYQSCACGWRQQQSWTRAIWARQSCWHQWSFHFPAIGSHSLSPAEDLALSHSSLLTKQFQGCKESLSFLLWSASLHPCPSFVHLQTSSRHWLQLPFSISVPSGLSIWHRPETKQINQIMGHSRDLGLSLLQNTTQSKMCIFRFQKCWSCGALPQTHQVCQCASSLAHQVTPAALRTFRILEALHLYGGLLELFSLHLIFTRKLGLGPIISLEPAEDFT